MKFKNKTLYLLSVIVLSLYGCSQSSDISSNSTTATATNTPITNDYIDTTTAPSSVASEFTIAQVDVAQAYSLPVRSIYQKLISGRAANVRIYAYAPSYVTPSAIEVSVNGGAKTTVTCPSELEQYIPAKPISDYGNNKQPCTAKINANDVYSGMTLQVTSGSFSKTYYPNVSSVRDINVVIVPVTLNGKTSVVTADKLEKFKNDIKALLPFENVNVTVRKTNYTLPASINYSGSQVTLQNNLSGDDNWEAVLTELEKIRQSENPRVIYVGLIPSTNFSSGTTGVAFCNGCTNSLGQTSSSNNNSAIVLDVVKGGVVYRSIIHEIGHVLSAMHTTCGGAGNPDSNYPYSGGRLGKTFILDPDNLDNYFNPINQTTNEKKYDVMGYCEGRFLSDYNYSRVQKFSENKSYTISAHKTTFAELLSFAKTKLNENIVISGSINNNQIYLAPFTKTTNANISDDEGQYQIKIYTDSGKLISRRFNTAIIADTLKYVESFNLVLPPIDDNSKISQIEINKEGKIINVKAADNSILQQSSNFAKNASLQTSTFSDFNDFVSIDESNNEITVNWQSSQYPWLNLTLIGSDNIRTVFATNATGGKVNFSLENTAKGGKWEISLSQGINSTLQFIERN